MTIQLEQQRFFRSEQQYSSLLFMSFVLSYLLARCALYPLKLFRDRSSPASHTYAVASAALTFLASRATSSRAIGGTVLQWAGLTLDPAQMALALLVAQMLLGHGSGFAGSLVGLALPFLFDAR